MIFINHGFQTIVFIFIVMLSMFRPIYSADFIMCFLSNTMCYMELLQRCSQCILQPQWTGQCVNFCCVEIVDCVFRFSLFNVSIVVGFFQYFAFWFIQWGFIGILFYLLVCIFLVSQGQKTNVSLIWYELGQQFVGLYQI